MNYEFVLSRFTRTASVIDLRFDVVEQMRRKCIRHERRYRTVGKRADFKVTP